MNGKKAKEIRRITKEQTAHRDWPEVAYQQIDRRVKNYRKLLPNGQPNGEIGQYETHTLILSTCKRKFMKELKKVVKRDGLESIIVG